MAPAEVSTDTSTHNCGFCAHPFYVAATEAGKALINRTTSERLEPHDARLNELRSGAVHAVEKKRPDIAEGMMQEWVGICGGVYRTTNYYGLMGLCGEEQYLRYERDWLAREVAGLSPGQQPQVSASQSAYAAALVDQAFPALVSALAQLMRDQMATSPDWRGRSSEEIESEVRRSVQDHCWQLPWVSDDELRSLGMQFSSPSKNLVNEQWQTACGYCGAGIELHDLIESVTCGHCGATSRMRLSEIDRMRAHGATEDEAKAQVNLQAAVASEDIGTALKSTRAITDAMAPAGSPRSRELQYYYGRAMFPWLEGRDAELLEHLALSPSKSCRHCEQTVARAPDGDGRCPMCQQA